MFRNMNFAFKVRQSFIATWLPLRYSAKACARSARTSSQTRGGAPKYCRITFCTSIQYVENFFFSSSWLIFIKTKNGIGINGNLYPLKFSIRLWDWLSQVLFFKNAFVAWEKRCLTLVLKNEITSFQYFTINKKCNKNNQACFVFARH